MPFVKLDCGMLNSSLWINRDQRELFITSLLMAVPFELEEPTPQYEVDSLERTGYMVPAGWYGLVEAAGPGIVRQALLAKEPGMLALRALGTPDLESRSQNYGGRRLVRVDGGYLVLNYITYRERDYSNAERCKRYRTKLKTRQTMSRHVSTVTTPHVDMHADADAYSDQEAAQSAPPPPDVPRETPKPARKGTRMDPEAMLTDAWRAIAREYGLAPEATYRKFLNYWVAKPGKDATKLDWTRTFENWCITEAEGLPGKAQAPRFTPSPLPMPKGRPQVAPGEPRFSKGFAR